MTNSLFTKKDEKDGNVGIGKIPENLLPDLDKLSNEYYLQIPNKDATIYHTYYNDLDTQLKELFDKIQNDAFWNKICDNSPKCTYTFERVIEMNELYYSNPSPDFEKRNLYGVAANLIPHRDCILFNFRGIHLYRVIIGLTEGNHDTITHFINHNLEHKINRGDYMIFDFDRTLHQVKKENKNKTPRILLKLHFIVCDLDNCSKEYIYFVKCFYVCYYYIARYTEEIGSDPTTFMGFFYGLLWEYPFYSISKYGVSVCFLLLTLLQNKVFETEFMLANTYKFVTNDILGISLLYLSVVSFFWIRYKLFGIR